MNKIFFTSDTHFGHKNIIEYEDRPFSSVEEMDKELIKNWNEKISHNDSIYILGDFAFCGKEQALNILDKLNGKKYLIKGNHDRLVNDKDIAEKFEWIKDYFVLKYNKQKIILFHYPIQVWDCQHHGAIHLYGHVHSNKENNHPLLHNLENAFNVGVDVNEFKPISLEELLSRKSSKKI